MQDARIVGERAWQHLRERREHQGEDEADHDRPPDHAHRGRVRAFGLAGAEHPAHDHLAGDSDRVEDEGEEDEELVRDLVRAELRVSHPREYRRGDQKRGIERRRAHEDLPADPEERLHRPQARSP